MGKLRRAVLAVCDAEEAYARSFMEYLTEREGIPFEIQAFTSVNTLMEYAQSHVIDILLIAERTMTEQVRELPVRRLFLLSEGLLAEEGEASSGSEEKKESSEVSSSSIFKYQAASQIVREVMDCYAAEQTALRPAVPAGNCRVLGVYSPSAHPDKLLFALALGEYLAESGRVLYLNLDPSSGLGEAAAALGAVPSGKTLSDLIYCSRRKHGQLCYYLEGMRQKFGKLEYVLPSPYPEDLMDIAPEEWNQLLDCLKETAGYRTLLLDFGDCLRDLPSLLPVCEALYLPVGKDWISACRLRQFQKRLKEAGTPAEEPWARRVPLPYPAFAQEEDALFAVTRGIYYRLAADVEGGE